jgi:hypothetical protein
MKRTCSLRLAAVLATGILGASAAGAGPVPPGLVDCVPPAADPGATAAPDGPRVLRDDELDTLRGGLDLGFGIQISFGVDNLVFVNGELLSQTTLNFDPATLPELDGLVQFVRDGVVADPGSLADGVVATVIQNSVDSQVIQSLSVLNASFQGVDFVRTLRMEDLVGLQLSPLP